MKKVIITGSNGLLGQTLVKLLAADKNNYTVYGFSRGENRCKENNFAYISVDLTNKHLLKKAVKQIQPDVIINTAAMTQVDVCEVEKDACYLANVTLVKWLVDISEKNSCHLVQISTDFIFDGKKGNYKETDEPNPLSYYGFSKLKAEEIITNSSVHYTILRTILVYGLVDQMKRNNIVLWVREMLANNKEITIVNDQFRAPTYVEDLAMACKISMDKSAKGVFHISSSTLLSVYEIAQQIASVFNLDKNLIKPISSKTLNQRAIRPSKTGFDLSKTNTQLLFYPKSFKESLVAFKQKIS